MIKRWTDKILHLWLWDVRWRWDDVDCGNMLCVSISVCMYHHCIWTLLTVAPSSVSIELHSLPLHYSSEHPWLSSVSCQTSPSQDNPYFSTSQTSRWSISELLSPKMAISKGISDKILSYNWQQIYQIDNIVICSIVFVLEYCQLSQSLKEIISTEIYDYQIICTKWSF